MTIVTRSSEETVAFGRRLGRLLRAGHVVALRGPLGAGKTTLTKGLAEGLDVEDPRWVTSPTFVLIHEYEGRLPVYHIDAYRLGGSADADALGTDELMFGEGVAIVEWADRIEEALPPERLDIDLELGEGDERRLTLAPRGPAYERLVEEAERGARGMRLEA
jgi:tRNA threonylcarbamoyladenosine biosynthesis protein TsaE